MDTKRDMSPLENSAVYFPGTAASSAQGWAYQKHWFGGAIEARRRFSATGRTTSPKFPKGEVSFKQDMHVVGGGGFQNQPCSLHPIQHASALLAHRLTSNQKANVMYARCTSCTYFRKERGTTWLNDDNRTSVVHCIAAPRTPILQIRCVLRLSRILCDITSQYSRFLCDVGSPVDQ